MMSTRLAKIAESSAVIMRDDIIVDSGHGLLPSDCCKCKGPLDFIRIHDTFSSRTVLECRFCSHRHEID